MATTSVRKQVATTRKVSAVNTTKQRETRSKIRVFWEDYLKGEQGEIKNMRAVLQ